MRDTDKVQIWRITVDEPEGYDWGAIRTTTVEVLDFERGVVETRTRGVHEGDRVDLRGNYSIDDRATPEGAAEYRRRHGYTRLS